MLFEYIMAIWLSGCLLGEKLVKSGSLKTTHGKGIKYVGLSDGESRILMPNSKPESKKE